MERCIVCDRKLHAGEHPDNYPWHYDCEAAVGIPMERDPWYRRWLNRLDELLERMGL